MEQETIVLTSVTMGKELHAGHMLILANADLLRRGMGSGNPTFLVNNNTGPRAAGTLVSLSERMGLSFEDTARILSDGFIATDRLVEAYRGRASNAALVDQALQFLDQAGIDIFARNSGQMERDLRAAGFEVEMVSEAGNVRIAHPLVEKVNQAWAQTGFMFLDERGIKVLQKGGQLTATGKSFVSLCALAKTKAAEDSSPLLLFVDNEMDTLDSATAFSFLQDLGVAKRILTAGLGLNGGITSGTTGEALTLSEIADQFGGLTPKLAEALRFMTFTMPIRRVRGESYTPYDFRDNASFVEALNSCLEQSQTFANKVRQLLSDLQYGVSLQTDIPDSKVARWFSFLSLKVDEIKSATADKKLDSFGGTKIVKNEAEIRAFLERQGYSETEQDFRVRQYRSEDVDMVMKKNPYFDRLSSLLWMGEKIKALNESDFVMTKFLIDTYTKGLGFIDE